MARESAELLVRRTEVRGDVGELHILIWRVPEPVPPCGHLFKYRLAYVVDGQCVIRYDNERGKGDHRHLGQLEERYVFHTPQKLIEDFRRDVEAWSK